MLFLAPGDVAKGRVEPISWMRTCHAYAALGFDVRLVTLTIRRPDGVAPSEIWGHYGVEQSFRIARIPTPLGRNASIWSFRLWGGVTACAFGLRTIVRQVIRPSRVIVHTRLPVLAAPFLLGGFLLPRARRPRIIFETHVLPRQSQAWVVKSVDLVVTNSTRLANDIRDQFRLPVQRVLHAPLPPFNPINPCDKQDARTALALPSEVQIACYTGKMTEEQNEFLLRTASSLSSQLERFRFVLVGGNPEILEWTRKRISELNLNDVVILPGFVAPSTVGSYQSAADVLVYHMPDSVAIFPYCTPAKAYEYQAARRPIVATDIPLFEEVFGRDGERAIRVKEKSPEELANAIIDAFSLEDGGTDMADRAAAWVRERTWERRVELILGALGL